MIHLGSMLGINVGEDVLISYREDSGLYVHYRFYYIHSYRRSDRDEWFIRSTACSGGYTFNDLFDDMCCVVDVLRMIRYKVEVELVE